MGAAATKSFQKSGGGGVMGALSGKNKIPAAAGAPVLSLGGADSRKRSGSGVHWTVLAIGGQSGVEEGYMGPEDNIHVLRLDESGEYVHWQNTMYYLKEAIRKRLRAARVKRESDQMIVAAYEAQKAEEGKGPSSDVAKGWIPGNAHQGSFGGANREADPNANETSFREAARRARTSGAAVEAELNKAVEAGRNSLKLLQRYGHTSVVVGPVAIVFGGVTHGKATTNLATVRFWGLPIARLTEQIWRMESKSGDSLPDPAPEDPANRDPR